MAKQSRSKILAGILAVVMIVSLLPVNLFTTVFAAGINSYTVRLTDGTDVLDLDDVAITLTNKNDPTVTDTQNTVDGIATFENFVEEETTYTLTVAPVEGYEDVVASDYDVAADELNHDVTLTALEKVTVSGNVTYEVFDGESIVGNDAYEGATVEVSGYFTTQVVTDNTGAYSFETYKGKEITITVKPKTTDVQLENGTVNATYSADTSNVDVLLKHKTFDIKTNSDTVQNGSIDVGVNGVLYGEQKNFDVTANDGYRIDKVTVNGNEETGASGQKTYTVAIPEIKEHYEIIASFYKMTYKVTFTVGENGEVTYGEGETDKVAGGEIKSVTVDENGTLSFKAVANTADGYHVESVLGCDTPLTDGDNSTIDFDGTVASVTSDKEITVVFASNEYKVTLADTTNGSATIATESASGNPDLDAVKHGDKVYVQAKPEDGYEIDTIKVDGVVIDHTETINGYETLGTAITKDVTVEVTFVKKVALEDGSYEITLPEANATVDGVTYVADGSTVTFKALGEYKRVKINDSWKYVGDVVTVTLGNGNGEVSEITSIEVSKKNSGGWTNKKVLNITFDNTLPTISEVENDGKWFTETTKYSFTAADEHSGVKEVKYSNTNDISTATVLTISEGKYSFDVDVEYDGKYYIWIVDNCENTKTAEVNVRIDLKDPSITGFSFSTEENTALEDLINFLSFGTLCNQPIYVTVSAEDLPVTSGLKEITLFYGDKSITKSVEENENSAVFELTKAEFENGKDISAQVKDVSGRTSEKKAPTDFGYDSNNIKITEGEPVPEITIEENNVIYTDSANNKWFAGDTTFTVVAKDDAAGIKKVSIKLNGKDILSDSNGKAINANFSATETKSETFVINTELNPVEGKNVIVVEVENNAGTKTSEAYSKVLYIDEKDPDVKAYEISTKNNGALSKVINFLTFGIFCNEQVEITVTAADEVDTNGAASSGVKSITLWFGTQEMTKDVVDNKATFTIPASELVAGNVHSGEIKAVATDNVGNVTEVAVYPTDVNSDIKNSTLMLEKVDPTVDVQFAPAASEKNDATKDANDWYKSDVEFTVTAGDVDSGIRNVVITINDKELVNESYYNDEATDTETHEEVYKVNTSDAVRAADGSYTIKVVITDNAGNVNNTYTKTIYKDIDAPYITGFDFVPENYVEGSEDLYDDEGNPIVITTDYGFYFKEDTNVIISANDIEPTAGIKSITYYTVDFTNSTSGVKSEEQTVLVNAENKITITIPANFKGQIYAKATDNVDNVTDAFANPNSAIVEDADKHEKEEHISFTKADTAYTANDGTELYANDVDVTLTVTDTYSGIRDIEWSVVAPYDTEKNQSGKVTLNNDKTVTAGSDTDWTQTKTEVNLVTEMQKTIKVSNDSNNIIVKVKMTDRAGNTSEKQIEFSIDKFDPTIEIVYSNDEVHDEQYTDFFSTKRTATITVAERNFRASDIVFAITNTDKTIPTVDLKADATWTTTPNAEDPNKTTHVAVVEYTVDGDYTFDISYKDNAENPANTIEQHKFTIDMTKPVVSVAYDNNSALNGNYYKADRIATITIKEHNFDAARVNVVGVATDNGVTSTFPTESKWTSVGNDTYTATIAYTADSKYTFDIEFRDKANNSIDDYTPEEFYVDKTAPNLEISGVADKSANNGDVIPVITYSDTNFDKDAVTITLSGINNGVVNYSGSYADIANGQKYTYANFEKIQKVDDIYTLTAKLTDKAGNETEMTITFSANRFGSVYDLSKVEEIISKYLQTEQDIIFTETNVDALEREGILVKLTKNGTPKDLVEGTDYTVELTGGNGQWSVYTYTISKSLFTGDGRYSISVYSKDAAGNVNENIDESKEAEISFGIDKTAPVIVPVDLESGEQYPVELKKVSVEIKDNLVLESVKIYLNGKEIEYTVDGETYTFDIPESNSVQDVKIVAVDAAGNEYPVEIEDILVSTNIFVRWYNNTPLFIGSIIGVVLLGLGITAFILFGKKKKNEENK